MVLFMVNQLKILNRTLQTFEYDKALWVARSLNVAPTLDGQDNLIKQGGADGDQSRNEICLDAGPPGAPSMFSDDLAASRSGYIRPTTEMQPTASVLSTSIGRLACHQV
jgi:hypothetical protein